MSSMHYQRGNRSNYSQCLKDKKILGRRSQLSSRICVSYLRGWLRRPSLSLLPLSDSVSLPGSVGSSSCALLRSKYPLLVRWHGLSSPPLFLPASTGFVERRRKNAGKALGHYSISSRGLFVSQF